MITKLLCIHSCGMNSHVQTAWSLWYRVKANKADLDIKSHYINTMVLAVSC